MKGNEHAGTAGLILQRVNENPGWYGDTPVGETLARAQVEAQLAVAYELRTANILAAQATPDWLNTARARMGEDPFPPKDFTTPDPERLARVVQRTGLSLQTVTEVARELRTP